MKATRWFGLLLVMLALAVDAWLLKLLIFAEVTAADGNQPGVYLLLHSFVAAASAIGLAGFCGICQANKVRTMAVLIWAMAFFIPVVGIAGSLVIIYALSSRRSERESHPSRYVTRTPLLPTEEPASPGVDTRRVSAGWLAGVLGSARQASQRQQAVLATIRLTDKQAVPILKKALRDEDDDVRLLAYALLERKERAIVRRIAQATDRLPTTDGRDRLPLFRRVIQSYWEFINLGLAQGDVRRHLADVALNYAEQALAIDPHNPGLLFLQGKLRLEKGDYQRAEGSFRLAGRYGIDESRIRGYLAEIAWRQHRFGDVAVQLSGIRSGSGPVVLENLAAQWRNDESMAGLSG